MGNTDNLLMNLPEGVHLAQLSEDKLDYYWDKLNGMDKLFSDETRGDKVSFAKNMFLKGTVIFEIEEGLMVLSDLKEGLRCSAHFSFWDKKLSNKTDMVKNCLICAFFTFELERIEARIPDISSAVRRFVEKLGFRFEARLRNYSRYKGDLIDMLIYSLLKEEVV